MGMFIYLDARNLIDKDKSEDDNDDDINLHFYFDEDITESVNFNKSNEVDQNDFNKDDAMLKKKTDVSRVKKKKNKDVRKTYTPQFFESRNIKKLYFDSEGDRSINIEHPIDEFIYDDDDEMVKGNVDDQKNIVLSDGFNPCNKYHFRCNINYP